MTGTNVGAAKVVEGIGHLNRKVSPPKGQPGRKANITSNSGIHGGSVSLEGNSRGHPQGTAVTLVVRLRHRQKVNITSSPIEGHKAESSETEEDLSGHHRQEVNAEVHKEAAKVNYLLEALGRTAQYQRVRISSPPSKDNCYIWSVCCARS